MVNSAIVNNIGNYLRDHERGIKKSDGDNDVASSFTSALKIRKKYDLQEDVDRMKLVAATVSTKPRTDLFPKNITGELPIEVKNIISTAERVLDKRSINHPFFEIEYVEDLVGDILAMEFPSLTHDKLSEYIHEVVRWLARDYDIRKNGTRIGE